MPKLKTQRYWCATEGCNANDRKRGKYGFMDSVEFFSFPMKAKDTKARKRWLDLLRRKDYELKYHHRLCSLHFVDGRPTSAHPYPELFAYNNFKQAENVRSTSSIMKRCPQESESLTFSSCPSTTDSFQQMEQFASNIQIVDENMVTKLCIPVVNEETVATSGSLMSCVNLATDELADHDYLDQSSSTSERQFTDTGVQTYLSITEISQIEEKLKTLEHKVQNKDELLRDLVVDKVTKSDKHVQKYLGIPSIAILFGLFGLLDRISPDLSYWKGQDTKKHSEKKKRGPKRKLTRFHEFIITLLRLRLGLVSFVLGDLFGISCSRVSQIFTTWINYMNSVFSPLLKWPDSGKVKKFMPKSFKRLFPKTTCIIDCTEFFIEKPRHPTAQAQTYSSYKHKNTYKALISISPSRAITFVSKLWGGNVSDRYITEHSGFWDLIKPHDEVMADRGFLIRDLLLERHATLNIPPFTKKCEWGKGKILTSNDIRKTRNIAKLRIHVERAIERLKNFKILANTMPLKCKNVANQMIIVCAFLCNLQKPLVGK